MTAATTNQATILAMLESNPRGWPARVFAARLHLSMGRTLELLRQMRHAGAADVTHHGSGALWSTPARCIVLRQLAADRQRKRNRARQKASELARQDAATMAAWLHPTQRVIRAIDAPPLRPAGPVSVFRLAA